MMDNDALDLLSPSARAQAFTRLLEFSATMTNRFSKAELALFRGELTRLARSQHRPASPAST